MCGVRVVRQDNFSSGEKYRLETFLALTLQVMARDISTRLNQTDNTLLFERSFSIGRLVRDTYERESPCNTFIELARSYISGPDKAFCGARATNSKVNLCIIELLKENFIEEELLGTLTIFASMVLQTEGILKDNVLGSRRVGHIGELGEVITLNITVMSKYKQTAVIAQTQEGHNLLLSGANFHPEVGARVNITGEITSHESDKDCTTILKNVSTARCTITERFLEEVGYLFEGTTIESEEDYQILLLVFSLTQKKFYIESENEIILDYSSLIDMQNPNVFYYGELINEHSDFYFNLKESLIIRKKEVRPGVIGFTFIEIV